MSENQYHDRFERVFNQRVPLEVAQSFTDQQRAAIRTAFGGENWDGHTVDLRGVIPLFRWYFALVSGPDNRKKRGPGLDDRPRSNILGRIVGTVTMLVVLALLAVLLLF